MSQSAAFTAFTSDDPVLLPGEVEASRGFDRGSLPALQPSLFGRQPADFDASFASVERHTLTRGAWVDRHADWLTGSDTLFDDVLTSADWRAFTMEMFEQIVLQPRLMQRWKLDHVPASLEILQRMGDCLARRYDVDFTTVGCNLYRDGRDSVAWHGDRDARDRPHATIAVLSLGAPRTFRLRPRGGGESLGWVVRGGDLVVMGGSCQRTWQHTVPKVAVAGPRISVTFRHGYG